MIYRITIIVMAMTSAAFFASGCARQETANDTDVSTQTTVVEGEIASKTDGIAQTLAAPVSITQGSAPGGPRAAKSNPEPAYLASESQLLRGTAVSAEGAVAALRSKHFAQTARDFAADAAADPSAQDITSAYRAAIQKDLGRDDFLSDFACGLSLCLGVIRSRGGNEGYQSWSDSFFSNSGLPVYSFTEFSVTLGENEFENRFLFSVDPATNQVTAPLYRNIAPKSDG